MTGDWCQVGVPQSYHAGCSCVLYTSHESALGECRLSVCLSVPCPSPLPPAGKNSLLIRARTAEP